MFRKELDWLIVQIDEPNQTGIRNLYTEYYERVALSRGSKTKHQYWSGGYLDHICMMGTYGYKVYCLEEHFYPNEFSSSDVVLIILLHDLEKPFAYVDPKQTFRTDKDKYSFILGMCKSYTITLTEAHKNALKYIIMIHIKI